MSLLTTQDPKTATGVVAQQYAAITQAFGNVPNAFQLFSTSPTLLTQQWETISYYFTHPTLSGALLATIRMLVSQDNACSYCIGMNESLLINMYHQTPDAVAATKTNPEASPLNDKDKSMLLLVLKAVRTPQLIKKEDLNHVHAKGWSDKDIFDAVSHGARNVASDIIFNAFKIERDF